MPLQRRFLSRPLNLQWFNKGPVVHCYQIPKSVRHLFQIACGMDSLAFGESEVLGQVKKAYITAASAGSTGKILNRLFQTAFRIAKRVRTQTDIGRGMTSIASVTLGLATKVFGDLTSCNVMFVGVGESGRKTAHCLKSRGVYRLTIANRSL